ncbi:MAG: hypothetical protein BGO70_05395 [Bacteroidetes bacterium 43-93]|nr:glycosyltransferase family 4 protein [Bacteroidota bacterium]OJW96833.1 MAG: hypothetical protein BGO70_05395 [Bacteroidetes bacterium 43-93]
MNILIIDNSTAFTGAFKCALNEAELLSDKHHFVFILNKTSTLVPLLKEKGFAVYALPIREINKSVTGLLKYPFALLANIIRLKRIIRKERIDIVQMNDFYNLLGAGSTIFGAKIKLLTYVRFVPSSIPAALRNFWITVAQRYSYKVIAVSDTVLKQLPTRENTIRIYDPVNFSEHINAPTISSGNEIRILYLANYIQGKGQDYALEAFIHAYAQNKNLRLLFAGGDMDLHKNKQYKQKLEERVHREGLAGIVSFQGFTADIEKAIKNAAIVLNFSDSESFSMTCLEASYYGTPVIATRCGGPEEIIEHDKTGLLVPKQDIEAMTEAILKLANNTELRKHLGSAASSYVREKFGKDIFIQNFETLLNSMNNA